MKKIICIMLCVMIMLTLGACTDVELEPRDNKKDSDPESKTEDRVSMDNSEPDGESTASSSEPESSVDKGELVYTTVYPESYEERVAFYGDHWSQKYDYNDAYFNNSVFVGNSIMYHFSNYVSKQRGSDSTFLGNAAFFAAPSFSMYNNKHQTPDSPDCALPSYRGQAMNISDAVEQMNVSAVYLSLMALNDIAIYSDGMTGIEKTYDLVVELIEELKSNNPRLNVVVLSNTYIHSSRDNGAHKLNNGSISTLNIKVLEYCNNNNVDFIDIASVLLDNNNCLGDTFCSDSHCHLTSYAYNAWTHILRDYAAKKLDGTWINPPYMEGLVSKS